MSWLKKQIDQAVADMAAWPEWMRREAEAVWGEKMPGHATAAPMTDHWSVTVERNGEQIVTIESNCLSGREISPEDEEAIRTAARHLLAFIGDPVPSN
jgi:hypothetical protein